jgi:hypothetical protein
MIARHGRDIGRPGETIMKAAATVRGTKWRGACGAAIAVALSLCASRADAADPAVNVGVAEVVGAPDVSHLGVYPYAAGSLVIAAGPGSIVPSLGVGVCPEFGRWGFMSGVAFDVPVGTWVGFDAIGSFVHDQEGAKWSEAGFAAGGGLGVSFFADKWAVSPSVIALAVLNGPGWALVPAVNLSYTFDLSGKPPPTTAPAVGSSR